MRISWTGLLGLLLWGCVDSTDCPKGAEKFVESQSPRREYCRIQDPEGHYLRHGWEIHYHVTGKRIYRAHYLYGKEDGLRTFWWENGKRSQEEEWQNGFLLRRRSWYEDGKIREEQVMPSAQRDGSRTIWNEAGAITFEEKIPFRPPVPIATPEPRQPVVMPMVLHCENNMLAYDGPLVTLTMHQMASGQFEVNQRVKTTGWKSPKQTIDTNLGKDLRCQIAREKPFTIIFITDGPKISRFCAEQHDRSLNWVSVNSDGKEEFSSMPVGGCQVAPDFAGSTLGTQFNEAHKECGDLLARYWR